MNIGGFNAGVNYSQSGGLGANVGYGSDIGGGKELNFGLSYSQNDGLGASVGIENSHSNGVKSNLGLTIGQKTGLGFEASASYTKPGEKGRSTLNNPNSNSRLKGTGGSLSFNQRDGLQAGLDINGANAFQYDFQTGSLTGNTNYAMDYYRSSQREEYAKQRQAVISDGEDKYLKEKGGLSDKEIAKLNEDPDEKRKRIHEIALVRKEKGDTSLGDGTSTEGFFGDMVGELEDVRRVLLGGNSNRSGYIDEKGEYQVRTCFVKGTKIDIDNSQKPIEEIKFGDFVYAINEKIGKRSLRRVINTYVRETDRIYNLTFASGNRIETTATHPFYIQNMGWVEAKDLKVGYYSITRHNEALEITNIQIEDRKETVYNFTVEGDHNYYVGEDGVLVHNVDYLPPTLDDLGMDLANYLPFMGGGVMANRRSLELYKLNNSILGKAPSDDEIVRNYKSKESLEEFQKGQKVGYDNNNSITRKFVEEVYNFRLALGTSTETTNETQEFFNDQFQQSEKETGKKLSEAYKEGLILGAKQKAISIAYKIYQVEENVKNLQDPKKYVQKVIEFAPTVAFLTGAKLILKSGTDTKIQAEIAAKVQNQAALFGKPHKIIGGGAYGNLTKIKGMEKHHMPADSASPLSTRRGPAINMSTKDHRKTESWGSSAKAIEYRAKQQELINQGKFKEAQEMDIRDVRSKFGNKYNREIEQMIKYSEEEGLYR